MSVYVADQFLAPSGSSAALDAQVESYRRAHRLLLSLEGATK